MIQLRNDKPKGKGIILFLIFCAVSFTACENDEWNTYYNSSPETVDAKMWDAIQDSAKYSRFVDLVNDIGYDTLLSKRQGFTLFIPTNEAFEELESSEISLQKILDYHISPTVFISSQVLESRKLQTLGTKFVQFTRNGNRLLYDDIEVSDNSPLFRDGTFYELKKVAMPKPNLFEYTSLFSPVIYNYINQRKVVLIDKNLSIPIDFDDEGNTIYDSVYVEYNFFDLLYFSSTQFEEREIPTNFEDFQEWVDKNPSLLTYLKEPFFSIKKEYRDKEKTFLIFTQDQYNDALDVMADKLGDKFSTYDDIPKSWQDEVLIPYFLKVGVFDSSLTYNRFSKDVLKGELGDSVYFDHTNIDESSRYICSNGVAFNYVDLQVPDSLFNDTIWMEGEDLLIEKSENNYVFEDGVTSSTATVNPVIASEENSRGGSVFQVTFKSTFKDEYWVKFKLPKVFPRSYYFRYAASNRPSGTIEVYINGEYVGKHDNFLNYRPIVTAEGRINPIGPSGRQTNNFNSWVVDNITEYGDVEVQLVYKDGGMFKSSNGLNIDYVALVPINE